MYDGGSLQAVKLLGGFEIMCGRTACTLAPDTLVRACGFRNRQGKRQRPVWKDPPGGQQYYPSYNVAPASHTPVLLSSKHYPEGLEACSDRVIQPMKWGLVPPWHKGDPNKLEYETNNCRAEGMLTKRTYKTPLEKGNRCVILADGFFEWKRSKEGKQPYFIYFPQNPEDTKTTSLTDSKHVSITTTEQESQDTKSKVEPICFKPDPDTTINPEIKQDCQEPQDHFIQESDDKQNLLLSSGDKGLETEVKVESDCSGVGVVDSKAGDASSVEKKPVLKSHLTNDMMNLKFQSTREQTGGDEDEEWKGKRLLTMAGVFDVWQPPDGSPPLYSYSVITVDASPAMSWIHHRMPAILSTDEEVSDWLDFATVPLAKAVKMIGPKECISLHMVSPVVNNSRNKSPECIEQYDPKKVKKTASSNLMMNWLTKTKPLPNKEGPDTKKPKLQ